MSFSQDVKSELCAQRTAGCCRYAECYGMLLFGRSFSMGGISWLSSDKNSAEHLKSLIYSCFSVVASLSEGGVKKPTYLVSVDRENDIKKILIHYGHYGNHAVEGLNHSVFAKECCTEAFIRGAFLSCGSVCNPENDFHAEFALKRPELAEEFEDLLKARGLNPKTSLRAGKKIIYFKNGGDIEDLLTVIGATMHSLELMNVQIYKDMRNKTNRIKNCDNGNIAKTVKASMEQREAIEKLKKSGALYTLPEELYEAAMLRIEHPEAPLSELCIIAENKITRSGLNHRFKRIVEIANM
ncbi:MAG: DNA-binding protein WhiA [Clostridia bacterium]|nr:DNA-binding protein WhiA [Oscillospiraceae bacterium]MBR6694022.1 DNA-binding protein WhiA [Clostridia bacterium]